MLFLPVTFLFFVIWILVLRKFTLWSKMLSESKMVKNHCFKSLFKGIVTWRRWNCREVGFFIQCKCEEGEYQIVKINLKDGELNEFKSGLFALKWNVKLRGETFEEMQLLYFYLCSCGDGDILGLPGTASSDNNQLPSTIHSQFFSAIFKQDFISLYICYFIIIGIIPHEKLCIFHNYTVALNRYLGY